ncbi:MAG: hypothetical protein ACLTAI_08490 [Thomasclavelia sp.]
MESSAIKKSGKGRCDIILKVQKVILHHISLNLSILKNNHDNPDVLASKAIKQIEKVMI